MSDSRFFGSLLAAFTVAIVTLLCVLDYFQPGSINSELVKQVLFLVSPIIAAFLVMMNSNANRRGIENKTDAVQHTVENAEQKADQAAKNAEKAAETASQLAREKR